jgi:hypothetical protein
MGLRRARLRQTTRPGPAPAGFSKFPREAFNAELESGEYFFRVSAVSNRFRPDQFFRLWVNGDFVEMPFRIPGETLLNPADNRDVITVGALDSDRSSISLRLGKPDLWAPSSVTLTDGREFRGSSNAAALVAGLLTLRKMVQPSLTRKEIVEHALVWDWDQGSELRTSLTGGSGPCFPEMESASPEWLRPLLSFGGKLVATSEGPKLMLPFDPIRIAPTVARAHTLDRILWTPNGWNILSRMIPVPPSALEVFQVPADARLAEGPS